MTTFSFDSLLYLCALAKERTEDANDFGHVRSTFRPVVPTHGDKINQGFVDSEEECWSNSSKHHYGFFVYEKRKIRREYRDGRHIEFGGKAIINHGISTSKQQFSCRYRCIPIEICN